MTSFLVEVVKDKFLVNMRQFWSIIPVFASEPYEILSLQLNHFGHLENYEFQQIHERKRLITDLLISSYAGGEMFVKS